MNLKFSDGDVDNYYPCVGGFLWRTRSPITLLHAIAANVCVLMLKLFLDGISYVVVLNYVVRCNRSLGFSG